MLRRLLFVLALAGTAPFCPALVGDGAVVVAQSNDIALERKLRQARECYNHGNYAAALERAEAALKTDPRNSEALYIKTQAAELLAEQREREKALHQQRELAAYNNACEVATAEALNAFISDFPNSEYVYDARRRIDDLGLWDVAQKSDTREAYEKYIASSRLGAFADDARKRIDQIEEQERERQRLIEEEQRRQRMETEWNSIATSLEKDRLEAFLKEFPGSPYENEARLHVSLAKAEDSYSRNMLSDAVGYFQEAEKCGWFSGGSDAAHYADAKSRLQYKQMLGSSNKTDVGNYLLNLPSTSPYYNDISNHYALLLADELTSESTQQDYDRARSYTRDSATRSAVNQRVNTYRQMKKEQERAERAAQREVRRAERAATSDERRELRIERLLKALKIIGYIVLTPIAVLFGLSGLGA